MASRFWFAKPGYWRMLSMNGLGAKANKMAKYEASWIWFTKPGYR
jgi:hypothetical protein